MDEDAASVQFRGIEAVQNSRGLIVACGWVNGRNTAGNLVGFQPFVGVLMGPDEDADFVLVGIGSSDGQRAEITLLCRAGGISGAAECQESRLASGSRVGPAVAKALDVLDFSEIFIALEELFAYPFDN
jgi:hypothetical protein